MGDIWELRDCKNCHGEIYCDNDGLFCQLHDELPKSGSYFAEQVLKHNVEDPVELLNWYRNVCYQESGDTERETMARTINELFGENKQVFSEGRK